MGHSARSFLQFQDEGAASWASSVKLEVKPIAGELPSARSEKTLPTEPTIDDRPWADSSFDLAQGLKTTEMELDEPVIVPSSADEKEAWARGAAAHAAGALPDASPYEPGTTLDLCWLAGYRSPRP